MKEPPECKNCIMQTCPRNRWYCFVRMLMVAVRVWEKEA